MYFKQSVAIVTGAGRGIGRAAAEALASRGAQVVITSRSRTELEETMRRAEKAGGSTTPKPLIMVGDISSAAFVSELFKTVTERFGAPNILVNNAGVLHASPFKTMSPENWNETIAVNLTALFHTSQAFFNAKVAPGTPRTIINISSLGGLQNTPKFPGLSAYVASKFGVIGLTEALAVEGKPMGIRVNAIAPGAVDTVMLRNAAPHLKTSTTPHDLAGTICFLADPSLSGSLNGATIAIHSNE